MRKTFRTISALLVIATPVVPQTVTVQIEGARDIRRQSSVGNPPPGFIRLYGDSATGKLRCKDSDGNNCIPDSPPEPHTHVEADITDLKHQHPVVTVAGLPPASQHPNEIYVVTDATAKSTCSSGGGGVRVACVSDGSTWTPAAGDGVGTGGGGGTPGGSPGYVQYKVNDTTFGGDVGLQWDAANQRLAVGNGEMPYALTVSKNSATTQSVRSYSTNAIDASMLNLEKARGTFASPANVGTSDDIGGIVFNGWLNSAFRNVARIIARANGSPSGNNQPGKIDFQVNNGSALANIMTLNQNGATISGNLSVSGLISSSGSTVATLSNNLGAFASTTSSSLANVISDEVGTGALVFNQAPVLRVPSFATSDGSYSASWAVTSNCSGLGNGGKLTINSSNQIVCSSDAGGAGGGVSSWNSRTGDVVPQTGDYTAAQVTNAFDKSTSNDIGANYIDIGATAPANPGAGRYRLFLNSSTQKLACKDSSGADCMPSSTGSGHTIQDEGSALPQRTGLNFVGAAVQAVDDAANNRTNVTFDADLNTIASLSCLDGQVIKRASGAWACGTDQTGSGGGTFDPSAQYDLSNSNRVNVEYLSMTIANNSGSGTATYRTVCVSGSGVVSQCGTSNPRPLGICMQNCGTTGNARIAIAGKFSCDFDGAVTAGNWVTASTSQAGKCSDAGTTKPAIALGIALETGTIAGTYQLAKGGF